MCVVGGRGDPHAVLIEHSENRLDPEPVAVGVHELHYDPSLRSSSAEAKKAEAVRRISFARRNWAFSLRRRTFSRSEEHTSELQSRGHLVCRLLLEIKKEKNILYTSR